MFSDPSHDVVRIDLEVLAKISLGNEKYFNQFMNSLIKLFRTDRNLLEHRGSLIVRHLSLFLNAEKIYRALAKTLETEEDLEFASLMVLTLNLILLTAPELFEVRTQLRNIGQAEGSALFKALYRSWCHNSVATFSLCLLAQAYEHATSLVFQFAELEVTVNFLVEIDKLVQLLESPIFAKLRLQLLEPERYPNLFKCLYGLLMLLPQSSAFESLKNRLNTVASFALIPQVVKHDSQVNKSQINFEELLQHFRKVQQKRESVLRGTNLGNINNDIDDKKTPKQGAINSIASKVAKLQQVKK